MGDNELKQKVNKKCKKWASQNRRNVYSGIHGCGTAYPNGWIVYEDGTIKMEDKK